MKKLIPIIGLTLIPILNNAQEIYPEPEFSNEIYYLKPDNTLARLEKNYAKPGHKSKLGGLGGTESSYQIEGEKSLLSIPSVGNLRFVFFQSAGGSQPLVPDSLIRQSGYDPAEINKMLEKANDPSKMISLYKAESTKGIRKIILAKSGPAIPFSGKNKSSPKFDLVVKQIRSGYYVISSEKNLPPGEYAFTFYLATGGNMDGSITLFSFTIEE